MALDLAGRTGWAMDRDGEVRTGIWTLTRGELGGRRSPIPMLRLWKRLERLCRGVSLIAIEETFARGDARYRLDSLQHAAILWCCLNGVRFLRASPNEWKKATLGSGRCSREEYWRAAIDYWPQLSIWTHDQAAALWLLEYSRS